MHMLRIVIHGAIVNLLPLADKYISPKRLADLEVTKGSQHHDFFPSRPLCSLTKINP